MHALRFCIQILDYLASQDLPGQSGDSCLARMSRPRLLADNIGFPTFYKEGVHVL